MLTILVVYGTRPEAIKLAPVLRAMDASQSLDPVIVVTGQHRTMLDQVNTLFGIRPHYDLDVLTGRPDLAGITSLVMSGLGPILQERRPDLVVVQGDTSTVFSAALASFYARIPVAHVEAGLRTGDRYDPFPEEINRRLTTALASLHLAPTPTSRANLLAEGIRPDTIHVTGNTVIDALLDVTARQIAPINPVLSRVDRAERVVLVTSHRRENWGAPMVGISRAIARLAHRFPGVLFVLPAHLNPTVREALLPALVGVPNVLVTEPLDYVDLAYVMGACTLVLTDSGGIQEEAPSLGKPVLVLRETTERPEAVIANTVRLIGTDEDRIVAATTELLTDPVAYAVMAHAINPYGDGQAAGRIVGAIEHYFGIGERPVEFVAATRDAVTV
ncbi:UDP-N-acetylglucosamine 2-epimerase (non-hydrolyzing) [Cryobacterium sp. SO2]|uniref:non-hydrolyzing UDP-N-acetylglucosamine 2-epimerase n=1 Tax=Cryobacterium sp. SO2 TaxID=1897060 RepID=UPI00223D1B03|nr:UDP-N-acetylglucosamine 2-epimerase (non-hydrolyzing) [Cryobacterium sp. SO2]WEO76923.1 UDP-N-acetylglucosamine 2-epimerase (non-hydrolyzing) [Cryobacterium sp. SO2]